MATWLDRVIARTDAGMVYAERRERWGLFAACLVVNAAACALQLSWR